MKTATRKGSHEKEKETVFDQKEALGQERTEGLVQSERKEASATA